MNRSEPTPAEVDVHVDAYGLSDVGKVRRRNEDQFAIALLSRSLSLRHTSLSDTSTFERFGQTAAHLFVVADGVGGVTGGELASGTAVEALTQYIAQTAGCYYNVDLTGEHEFLDRLEEAAQHAHDRVRAHSSTGQGPATTLTMVTMLWPRAYIVHIGDSRGYHLRGDTLRQFTRDQTMGELLVDEGVVTEQQARAAGLDNVLTSAVGAEMAPSIGVLDLRIDDTVLLCTDGLTKHVTDERIERILSIAANATAACETLVQEALDGGGSDNVTVVVARLRRSTA